MNDNLKTNFDPREIKGLFTHEQNDPKKGEDGCPWKEVYAKESKDRPICFSWNQLPVHDENKEILGALQKICDSGHTFDMYFVMSINRSEVAYFKATIVDFATTQDEYNAKYSKWKSENPKSSRIQSKFSDYRGDKIVFLASFEPLDGDKRIPLKNFIIYKDMNYNPRRGNIVAYTKILTDNEIKTKEMINDYVNLLKEKKNVILQGAPGTGKTYSTAEIAVKLLDGEGAVLTDHKTVMTRYEELRKDGRIFFTTFHQSMDYEDFVEGMKPRPMLNKQGESVGVEYKVEAGIFKQACESAKDKSVVLIIDEINRGNVSKIFGELITLIESDKRIDKEHPNHTIYVKLPYSSHKNDKGVEERDDFGVPSSLYIIGTMNTTDRSTGTLDYALRRRFSFITLESKEEVVKEYYDDFNEALGVVAVGLFHDVKKFIKDHVSGDYGIDDLMVGHSYFMAKDEGELRDKMKYEVIPLIREYINDGILNVSRDEAKKYTDEWCKLNVVEIKETQQKQEGEGNKSDLDRGGEPASSDTADTEQQNVG